MTATKDCVFLFLNISGSVFLFFVFCFQNSGKLRKQGGIQLVNCRL